MRETEATPFEEKPNSSKRMLERASEIILVVLISERAEGRRMEKTITKRVGLNSMIVKRKLTRNFATARLRKQREQNNIFRPF